MFDFQVFNAVIEVSEKNDDLQKRLNILYDEITLAVYTNVSRGLFERHKLVFSFMLCVAVLTQEGIIKHSQWNYLLRGPLGTKTIEKKKPDYPTVTDAMWVAVNYLTKNYSYFKDLPSDITNVITLTIGDFEQVKYIFLKLIGHCIHIYKTAI